MPKPAPAALVLAPGGAALAVPELIADAGDAAARATLEFFAARIANRHTREAYVRAVWRFCAWCDEHGVALRQLVPTSVAAYYEHLATTVSITTVKQQSSALRCWLDYLTAQGAMSLNPALSVRTPRLVVLEGKTPVLERDQARRFFATLDAAVAGDRPLLALRDRALFGVMLYGFVRVGAAVRLRVRDVEDDGADAEHAALRLHEKGGQHRRIPCHHQARAYLRAYVTAAQLNPLGAAPLFQSAARRSRRSGDELSGKPLSPAAVWSILKQRAEEARLPAHVCNHSFRATGITLHQRNGGRLEDAQALAGHADARTTRLYVRQPPQLAQREVERVQL